MYNHINHILIICVALAIVYLVLLAQVFHYNAKLKMFPSCSPLYTQYLEQSLTQRDLKNYLLSKWMIK